MLSDSTTPTVVVVMVTHDRPDVATNSIQTLTAQTHSLDAIYLVDSGSTLANRAALGDLAPAVNLIAVDENIGYAAGLALGMQRALNERNPDYYWLFDDDSPVSPDSLTHALEIFKDSPNIGIVGNRGGRMRLGQMRRLTPPLEGIIDVHYCHVDNALVSREAVLRAGTPRPDYFIMLEDVEYTSRVRLSGLRVVVASAVVSAPMHLGSFGPRRFWRYYYQSRNHLRYVLDRRSFLGVIGWFARETRICVAGFGKGGGGFTKLRMVVLGGVHGARKKMGRTVEPGSI